MAQIIISPSLRKNTWLPEYQTISGITAPISSRTSGGNFYPAPVFAITKINGNVPWSQLSARGVTHLQRSVTINPAYASVPFANQYANYQYKGPSGGSLPYLTSQAEVNTWVDSNIGIGAGALDHIYSGELVENGMTEQILDGSGNDITNYETNPDYAYQRIYSRLQSAYGITSPNQCNSYGDYGRDSYNQFGAPLWFGKLPGSSTFAVHRDALSTVAKAKKKFSGFKTSLSLGADHHYYASGGPTFRNRMSKYYINSSRFIYNSFVYDMIYEFEKWNIGNQWTKTVAYLWTQYEPLESEIDDDVRKSALHFDSPLGDLYRGSPGMQMSFTTAVDMAVISTLLGNGFIAWDDSLIWGTNINRFFGDNPPEMYWKPSGGSTSLYTGAVGQPTLVTSGNYFPHRHQAVAENGLFAGRWLCSQVWNRTHTLEYAPFTYNLNGGSSQNGYKAGSTPQDSGNNYGLPYVSRYGLSNPGQHNVVDSFETNKPIVWWGEGTGGNVLMVRNPQALPHTITNYTVTKDGTKTVSVQGSGWGFFTYD